MKKSFSLFTLVIILGLGDVYTQALRPHIRDTFYLKLTTVAIDDDSHKFIDKTKISTDISYKKYTYLFEDELHPSLPEENNKELEDFWNEDASIYENYLPYQPYVTYQQYLKYIPLMGNVYILNNSLSHYKLYSNDLSFNEYLKTLKYLEIRESDSSFSFIFPYYRDYLYNFDYLDYDDYLQKIQKTIGTSKYDLPITPYYEPFTQFVKHNSSVSFYEYMNHIMYPSVRSTIYTQKSSDTCITSVNGRCIVFHNFETEPNLSFIIEDSNKADSIPYHLITNAIQELKITAYNKWYNSRTISISQKGELKIRGLKSVSKKQVSLELWIDMIKNISDGSPFKDRLKKIFALYVSAAEPKQEIEFLPSINTILNEISEIYPDIDSIQGYEKLTSLRIKPRELTKGYNSAFTLFPELFSPQNLNSSGIQKGSINDFSLNFSYMLPYSFYYNRHFTFKSTLGFGILYNNLNYQLSDKETYYIDSAYTKPIASTHFVKFEDVNDIRLNTSQFGFNTKLRTSFKNIVFFDVEGGLISQKLSVDFGNDYLLTPDTLKIKEPHFTGKRYWSLYHSFGLGIQPFYFQPKLGNKRLIINPVLQLKAFSPNFRRNQTPLIYMDNMESPSSTDKILINSKNKYIYAFLFSVNFQYNKPHTKALKRILNLD